MRIDAVDLQLNLTQESNDWYPLRR